MAALSWIVLAIVLWALAPLLIRLTRDGRPHQPLLLEVGGGATVYNHREPAIRPALFISTRNQKGKSPMESTTLYYKQGGSDKVYQATIDTKRRRTSSSTSPTAGAAPRCKPAPRLRLRSPTIKRSESTTSSSRRKPRRVTHPAKTARRTSTPTGNSRSPASCPNCSIPSRIATSSGSSTTRRSALRRSSTGNAS